MSSASTSWTVVSSEVATALVELVVEEEALVSAATEVPQPARRRTAAVPARAWRNRVEERSQVDREWRMDAAFRSRGAGLSGWWCRLWSTRLSGRWADLVGFL